MLLHRETESNPQFDNIRTDLFYSLLEEGIKDEEQLHLFIRAYLNYSIPRHRVCPHHVSPFDFIAEQYFEREASVLGFANRAGGKTLATQVLSVTECLTKPGIEIVSSGAVRSQADRGYEYVQQMLGGEQLIAEQVISSLRSKTRFFNGAMLEIVTGSYAGFNSPHPNKFRCIAKGNNVLLSDDKASRRIEDIRPGDRVVTWDGATFKSGAVTRSACVGIEPTLTLSLSNGRTLTCTPDHRLLATSGAWVRADECVVGTALKGGPMPHLQGEAGANHEKSIQDGHVREVLADDLEKYSRPSIMQGLRRALTWTSAKQIRFVSSLLERTQACQPAQRKALSRLWRWYQSGLNALSVLSLQESTRGEEDVPGLWRTITTKIYHALSSTLASVSLFSRSAGSYGGDARRSLHEKWKDFSARATNDRAAYSLGDPIRTPGPQWSVDSGLRLAPTSDGNRSARFILARSAEISGTRPAQAQGTRRTGLEGDLCSERQDTLVVHVTRIDPGPTVPVYDLTIPEFSNFLAEGVVVHNCDEVELLHWSVLQQSMSMSQEKNGWAAGDCYTSTRKISSGTMQKLLDMAEEKHIRVLSWCIFEILEPCKRKCHGDPVYGDCPAFSYRDKDGQEKPMCGGKAHDLPPGGFYKIADFVKKVSLMDRETWETEWLNLRPSSGALVYGEYFKDEAPFVVPSAEVGELLKRAKEERWQRVIAIDFGANFYATYAAQDPRSKIWYIYSEYWFSAEHDLPLSRHAQHVREGDPLGWDNRALVFADPSGRQAIRDLEEYKIFAQQANNDVYGGINHVKKLLQIRPDGLPGLRFFHSCPRIRKELGELYIHKLDRAGDPQKDTVMKRDDHGADALRYALYSFETVGTGRYKMRKLRGVG